MTQKCEERINVERREASKKKSRKETVEGKWKRIKKGLKNKKKERMQGMMREYRKEGRRG